MKSRLLCLLLCALLTVTCVSCQINNKKDSTDKNPELVDSSDAEGDDTSVNDKKHIIEEDEPPIVTSTLKTEVDSDNGINIQKSDWDKIAFKMGDAKYSLPFSYARISENWIFNPGEYGCDADFSLEPGEKTTPNVDLHHKNSDCIMTVGFYNPTNETVKIADAKIWAFELSITKADKYPKIKLPGGLTWGSSVVDVVLAYGTPEIPVVNREERGCWEYSFKHDYSVYYSIVIDKKKGLTEFSYKNYNLKP